MASGRDQVSLLAEKLETMSTSESELYKVEKVAGKGVGCVAVKEIKKGSLVLREAPQMLYPDMDGVRTVEESFRHIEVVIEAFMEMSVEDQESFLDLHNKFDDDKTNWSDGMGKQFTALARSADQMTFPKRRP